MVLDVLRSTFVKVGSTLSGREGVAGRAKDSSAHSVRRVSCCKVALLGFRGLFRVVKWLVSSDLVRREAVA